MRILLTAITLALALAVTGIRVDAQSGYDLFQKALATERADGNLREAIRLYERVTQDKGADRALVARALIRIGECHEKLGQNEAVRAYERVLRDFSEQAESAKVARGRLAVLTTAPSPVRGMTAKLVWSGPEAAYVFGSPAPDSRTFLFTDWDTGDLAARDLATGTTRRLTHSGGWNVSGDYTDMSVSSRDGGSVAYTWFIEGESRWELRVLPSNATGTTRPRTLFRGESLVDYMQPQAWTPDGRRLIVTRRLADQAWQIALVGVQDGRTTVLKTVGWQSVGRVSLSPDGRYLAYDVAVDGAARDILVLAADGSVEHTVVGGPSVDRLPLWSPDGSQLLFLSNRTGANGLWSVNVRDGRADGSPHLIKSDLGNARLLGTSQAGTLFYVLAGEDRSNVHIAPLDNTARVAAEPRRVIETFVNSNLGPAWSPDGARLAYLSNRPRSSLVVKSMPGGGERVIPVTLPLANRFQSGPDWFPDGESLLVLVDNRDRAGVHFYRVPLSGEPPALVHSVTGGIPSFDLSPDGKSLFYIDRANPTDLDWRLMRFDLQSKRVSVVLADEWFISLAVSPDSSMVAYIKTTRLRQPGQAFRTSLHVVPAGGGSPRELLRSADAGASRYNTMGWTPDQKHILFVTDGEREADPRIGLRVPVGGGLAQPFGLAIPGRPKNLRVHPDGRQLVFGLVETSASEVWALENFLPRAPASR